MTLGHELCHRAGLDPNSGGAFLPHINAAKYGYNLCIQSGNCKSLMIGK